MKPEGKTLTDGLYRGEYGAVIKTWEAAGYKTDTEPVAVIGALAFVGRIDEAKALFESCDLSPSEQIESQFYLGVGHTRLSRYREARHYFGRNLRRLPSTKSDRDIFFIHQGLGFYRYFNGRFRFALRYAEQALKKSRAANFIYGQALSEDLLSHCRVRIGEIVPGLSGLRSAQQKAKQLGDSGLNNAIAISSAIYQAKFRLTAKQAIRLLTKTLKSIEVEDNYSKAALLIEFAEVYINAGRRDLAHKVLERAIEAVYATKNYRQEVMVNTKFARLHLLSGMTTQALTALSLCRRICNPKVDLPLLIEVLSLEAHAYEQMQQRQKKSDVEKQIAQLVQFSGDLTDIRFLNLQQTDLEPLVRKGQDLIADLIRNFAETDGVNQVLESGYLGLLIYALQLDPTKISLCLDLVPGSLTVVSQGQVRYVAQGLSPTLRKMILVLKDQGNATKAELINKIWGYKYDQFMHDPVVFAALGRLRSLLGEFKDMIRLTEQGYSFADNVDLRANPNLTNKKSTKLPNQVTQSTTSGQVDQLNIRQLQIIGYLNGQEFIDIQICQKLFKVSPITACRDLSQLTERGLVARIGRARATKYVLPRQ